MNPFSIVHQALSDNRPEARRSRSWRDDLRNKVGDDLHHILYTLAQGKAWMAELPDGRCSAPVLPSSDVRLRAAMFLHEALYGRAVPQTEIQKADQEAKEMESIRALSDEELELEAMKIIEGRRSAPRLVAHSSAVVSTTIPLQTESLADKIFASIPSEEQDE